MYSDDIVMSERERETEREREREREKESERDIGVRVVGIEAGGEKEGGRGKTEREGGRGREINERTVRERRKWANIQSVLIFSTLCDRLRVLYY